VKIIVGRNEVRNYNLIATTPRKKKGNEDGVDGCGIERERVAGERRSEKGEIKPLTRLATKCQK
jgi:hypothetical protein